MSQRPGEDIEGGHHAIPLSRSLFPSLFSLFILEACFEFLTHVGHPSNGSLWSMGLNAGSAIVVALLIHQNYPVNGKWILLNYFVGASVMVFIGWFYGLANPALSIHQILWWINVGIFVAGFLLDIN